MKPTLDDIKALIDRLAEKIDAPQKLLPTYGHSLDGAHPHIEADANGMLYYVVMERGEELRREVALDTTDLLYKVFDMVTFSMAVAYELRHRIQSEDFRRQLFAKQLALLGMLDEEWKARKQKDHQQFLRWSPFDDDVHIRSDYARQLRDNGMPADEAWATACKKYPEPKAG